MKARTIYETQNFTRGLDPKDAMNVGQKMLDKKLIEETKWVIDIKSLGHIYDIEKVVHDYHGSPYVILHYKDRSSWPYRATSTEVFTDSCYKSEDAEKEIQQKIDNPNGWHENPKLKESYNFERNLDPKVAMGTGLQQQFIKMMNELRLSQSVGAINLNKLTTTSPRWLDISFYDDAHKFTAILNKIFPKDVFTKITYSNNHKSFKNQFHLTINPAYEQYFINAFTPDGYIKESVNFERGLDPKVAMNTGDVAGRKKEKEFIHEVNILRQRNLNLVDAKKFIRTENWHGDEVRILGLTNSYQLFGFNYFNGEGWDYCTWDRQGQQNSSGVDTWVTWMNINKDVATKAYAKFNKEANESVNFERGLDPKEAMGTGLFKFEVEFQDDFEVFEDGEREDARKWRLGDLRILTVEGDVDEENIDLEINLSNQDNIIFMSLYQTGPAMPIRNKDFARIIINNIKHNIPVDDFYETLSNGQVILTIMKYYQDLKNATT